MPRIVLTHAVEDVERWLEGKAERAAAIGAAGTNVTDRVALDGSNKIAVTADVHDMDAAQAMITSPRRTPEREPSAQVALPLPARLAHTNRKCPLNRLRFVGAVVCPSRVQRKPDRRERRRAYQARAQRRAGEEAARSRRPDPLR